ncbi:protein set-like protein [Plakobranchus ocellatus]|uniref:Protein set-like protein n=1 Tax=Plakobranchus ocellatus TaxID=259542 RepID=A0AAV4DCH4_9GAST|nr:protein set-like protein [Plakobranchus ocellatus]
MRDETVGSNITREDMKALAYLRNIEVEQFEGLLTSGYRIHFYFDKNPYFNNSHLCKEVYTKVNPDAPPSTQTTIKWKPCMKLISEDGDEDCPPTDEGNARCPAGTRTANSDAQSFFQWFTQPTDCDSDAVGSAIIGDIWKNPLALLENKPLVKDPWDEKLNFVYARDDMTARIVHGFPLPAELKKFRKMIDANAASLIHFSMTGQTQPTRAVITRLSAGPMLTEIVEQGCRIVCGKTGFKLCLYSAHDNLLTAMLEALGIWDKKWPPFAADLRFELYREVGGKDFYVRILYNGKVRKDFYVRILYNGKVDFYVRILYNGKEQRVRGQEESYMLWMDFCDAMKRFLVTRPEYQKLCSSSVKDKSFPECGRSCPGQGKSRQGTGKCGQDTACVV